MEGRSWIRQAAGICGGLGVVIGAFGAHALKETLTRRGTLVSTVVLYFESIRPIPIG